MEKSGQLKLGVIISYITTAVSIVISLVYTPILTSLLGQNEYGLYTVVASIVNYLSLFSLGFGSAYLRYYAKYKEKNEQKNIDKLNGIFLIVFLCLGCLAFITGIFLVNNVQLVLGSKISNDEINLAQKLMLILVVNIVLTFPSGVFNSIVISQECYVFQRGVNLISKIANPLLVLPLLIAGYKSVAVVTVTTLLTAASLLVNMFYCFKKLKTKFEFRNLDFRILKDISSFSLFVFLNMIIDQINWNVDKFLLIRFSGTAAVAVYGIAAQINSLYLTFSSSISTVFTPRVNMLVAKGNSDEILTELFIKVGRIQAMVMLLVLQGFIVFGRYFIEIWVGTGYAEVYPIALILIIPVTVPLIQNLGIDIQRAKNKHQFRSIIYSIMAFGNIIISIPLTKLYGAVGSAIGTGISLIIGNGIIMNLYYHKKMGLDMIRFWKNIFSFIPAMLLNIFLGFVIMRYITFQSFIHYLIIIVIFIAVYGISLWGLGMNKQEKDMVRSALGHFKIAKKV